MEVELIRCSHVKRVSRFTQLGKHCLTTLGQHMLLLQRKYNREVIPCLYLDYGMVNLTYLICAYINMVERPEFCQKLDCSVCFNL